MSFHRLSEIITATVVTPGNVGDASVAAGLIDDLLNDDSAAATGAKVSGDSAYGTGEFQQRLDDADIASRCRTQSPTAPGGLFTKDRFAINLDDDTVTCPNGVTVSIRHSRRRKTRPTSGLPPSRAADVQRLWASVLGARVSQDFIGGTSVTRRRQARDPVGHRPPPAPDTSPYPAALMPSTANESSGRSDRPDRSRGEIPICPDPLPLPCE